MKAEVLFYPWLLLIIEISLIKEPGIKAAETSKSSNQGGTVILNCELKFPDNKPVDTIIQWKKSNLKTPVFLRYSNYDANIHEDFVGRIELVQGASLKITRIQAKDEGWYECTIDFINGIGDTKKNGTWVYLNVNTPPKITDSTPSKYKQQQGKTITLYCKVSGTPEPTGFWTKDNREVRSSSRVTISSDNTEVEIRDLQRSDGGTYTCKFSNTIGSISQRIDLIVEGAAYILSPPSNTTAVEGQRVTLHCGADAFPNNITYRWYFNDRNVNTYLGYGQRIYIQPDGTLVLSSVNKDDMGWYICRPSNGVGQDPEASAFLNVTYLPKILSMPSRLIWALGFTERLDCLVDANPPVSEIIWIKDRFIVQFGQGSTTQLANGSLLIYNVKKSDEGSYSCTPVSSLGNGQPSPLVQVIVRDPPKFTYRPEARYIRKPNDSVVMPCGASGVPPPLITWRKVSGVLDFGGRVTRLGGNLTIVHIEKQDHGLYECEASNDFTRIVTTTQLIIESTTPHAPYNVTVITSWFDAYVTWIPAYNGGSTQSFVIWYRSVNGEVSTWVTMRIENATNLKVFRLEPDTLYEFKVLSRNAYGDGNFSEVKLARTLGNRTQTSRRHEIGEADSYPTALPTLPSGHTYIPIITRPLGERPPSPRNTTAFFENGGIRITWLAPTANNKTPILYYVIEQTTSNNWKPLDNQVIAPSTSSFIKDGIIPSTTYRFRVYAYSSVSYSLPGNEAVIVTPADLHKPATVTADYSEESKGLFLSEAEIGGIVGGLLFLLVAVLLAIIGIICSRKKDRSRPDKYGNVKYMGTSEEMERTTVPHRMEDSSKWSRSFSDSRADAIRGYEGSGVFIVPDANRQLYRKEDLQHDNYLWDGLNPSSNTFDTDQSYSRHNRSRDSYKRYDNVDSFESGWYPESQRDRSYPDSQGHSLTRPRSIKSPYTSHGFPDPVDDFMNRKPSSGRWRDIGDSDSDDNGFLPLRPPLPFGYDPTPINRFPSYGDRSYDRSYSRDQPSYIDNDDDVFSPHIPHVQKSGFPRHSSMKPSSTQTYLTDDPISFTTPYNDISSVHPSPEHTYQNIPFQRPWHSFPTYNSNDRDIPKFDNPRLTHSLGYNPPKQVARVQPNNTSPKTYTRDHLQGTVDKLRRGPRHRKSRSACRNSAPEFDRSDGYPVGRRGHASDSEAGRGRDFDRHGRPYSYDSDPSSYIPRGSLRGRYFPDSRSFRDDPTPDSLSSGIGSKNTSQATGSTSGSRVPRPSLSYSSLLSPQDNDFSQDSPFHDQSLHRDTSADENYEFDTPDLDTILAYPASSGGDELLSAIESGLSTSDFYYDLYPKPSKQSKYENSEQRFEKLRQEYHQFQRQQHEMSQHHHFIDSEML
ncbi:protein turtle homolog A-like isoform X4 [Mytilus galloprovincialis]|uniref:protein turtle homolog A-like isoform X4 n=1 Tax=Mytilus galloprovincialis TaxID=29158 RepID=UPI003F7BBC12